MGLKVLGIDTATDVLGIALTEDRNLLAEYRSNIKKAHAEKLIDAIDRLLSDVRLQLCEVDCIAISIGPGSFTGLRIGLSTVKGLSFATEIPVVSVITLDALAHAVRLWEHRICPLIVSQADEAYTALYHSDHLTVKRLCDYQLIRLSELKRFITRKTLIVGVGVKNLSNYIDSKRMSIAPPEFGLLNARIIAELGYEKYVRGERENIETLQPFYLKDFKAKYKNDAFHQA